MFVRQVSLQSSNFKTIQHEERDVYSTPQIILLQCVLHLMGCERKWTCFTYLYVKKCAIY